MAEPPPQPDEVVSPDAKWPPYSAIDTKKYTVELTPVHDFPPKAEVTDRTRDVTGAEAGENTERQDTLSELGDGERLRLLAANGIDLRDQRPGGLAALQAYVLDSELTRANEEGVLFSRVVCRTEDGRYDRVSFSYTETASNLQRQSVAKTTSSFGVPGIFKLDASWNNAVAIAESRKDVTIRFEASQVLPKAHIVFDFRDLRPSAQLLEAVEEACARKSDPGGALLTALKRFGHFVPLNIILGGRMVLSTTTQLHDDALFGAVETQLKAAAGARFAIEGVPVEADGGGGMGDWRKDEQTAIAQAKDLHMDLKGGLMALGSANPDKPGKAWVDSVGPWERWRVIGFEKETLVPITDLLPPALKQTCLDVLRPYFVAHLRATRGQDAGPHGDDVYPALEDPDARRVKRIKTITVQYGDNFDGFQWTYELYPEGDKSTEGSRGYESNNKIGAWRGFETAVITLAEDEVVECIEVGCDAGNGTVRKVAFRTNQSRYPDFGFYGRAETAELHKLAAPRIVGFHGYKAVLVHCIGPTYLRLADNAISPGFLLALEPELFPDRDCGPVR